MTPVPILFYGDSPDLQTGLGRIGRDLAVLCASLPEFRVGYLGRGGVGSRQLPFIQYNFPEVDQWGEGHIERAWADFAGTTTGIIFSIWDASRLGWFATPYREALPPSLYKFLTSGNFQRWGYFPVDSAGVGGRLTGASREVITGYDRVLGYGAWGAEVISRTIGREVDWIPHGMNLGIWTPRDRTASRMAMGLSQDATVIGCVMTNQIRKDWGLACAIAAELKDCVFWFHIDELVRDFRWDLRALIADFGIGDRVKVTQSGSFSDEELSYWYSGCDLTMLPSLGEGFGLPIVESLACGVPCIHGKYGGGVELVPQEDWLVEPSDWRVEGLQNCVRPVYRPEDWVDVIRLVTQDRSPSPMANTEAITCRESVGHLGWDKLWPSCWSKWLKDGIDA